MKEPELYGGFSKEMQKAYEKQLLARFGDTVKAVIKESHQNIKNWTKEDWNQSKQEFDAICKKMTQMMQKFFLPSSKEVQEVIREHYHWLKKF
jgi:MerR family transcriptional regulator, thiopeptide resistance regulator